MSEQHEAQRVATLRAEKMMRLEEIKNRMSKDKYWQSVDITKVSLEEVEDFLTLIDLLKKVKDEIDTEMENGEFSEMFKGKLSVVSDIMRRFSGKETMRELRDIIGNNLFTTGGYINRLLRGEMEKKFAKRIKNEVTDFLVSLQEG